MKKGIVAIAIFTGMSLTGFSQVSQKALSANKWYSNGVFENKNMVLTKVKPSKTESTIEFNPGGLLNYCSVAVSDLINPEGLEVKAGTEYCDQQFSYTIKGAYIHITYPLIDWTYKTKLLKNGDLELIFTPEVANPTTK